jgi:hypothetical protein
MAIRLIAALSLAIALPAAAFDPFEIQVYDGTADERGHAGLEVHVNRHHDATHVTFEPSFGITDHWEIGGYFQTQQGHYEGVKLRTKLVTEIGWFRVGMNFEISLEPGGNWGGEIRPILCYDSARWLIAVNPNIGFPASFEPGAMAKIKTGPVAFGVEYYGSLPAGEHYVLGAIDLISIERLELNFGAGGGAAPVAKLIVGYAF